MSSDAGAMPFGGRPARRAEWRGARGRLSLAFVLSVLLHVGLLWRAHWPAGSTRPEAGSPVIEARLITPTVPDRVTEPSAVRPEPTPATPSPPSSPVTLPAGAPPARPAAEIPRDTQIANPVAPAPQPKAEAGPSPASRSVPDAALSAPSPPAAQSLPDAAQEAAQPPRSIASASDPKMDLASAPAEYRSPGEMDPPPRILSANDPVYPAHLKDVRGVVVLRALLGADGRIEALQVGRSTPPGVFDASALNAFAAAKFSPGYIAGVAVKSQLIIEVKYTPAERIVTLGGPSLR